jgi:hypothetical protein
MKLTKAIKLALRWARRSSAADPHGAITRVARLRSEMRALQGVEHDEREVARLASGAIGVDARLADALRQVADLADSALPSIDVLRTRDEAKRGLAAASRVRRFAQMLAEQVERTARRAA